MESITNKGAEMTSSIKDLSVTLGSLLGEFLEDGNRIIIEPKNQGGFTIHCEANIEKNTFTQTNDNIAELKEVTKKKTSTFGLNGDYEDSLHDDEDEWLEDVLEEENESEDENEFENNSDLSSTKSDSSDDEVKSKPLSKSDTPECRVVKRADFQPEKINHDSENDLYNSTFELQFYKCNNGNDLNKENDTIAYIGKKVAFPSFFDLQQGLKPKPGETWEVSIAGENPSKTVFFLNLHHKIS